MTLYSFTIIILVPHDGLEPSHPKIPEPKSGASTNSANGAINLTNSGAGYQNRTDDRRLEICCFTIKLIPLTKYYHAHIRCSHKNWITHPRFNVSQEYMLHPRSWYLHSRTEHEIFHWHGHCCHFHTLTLIGALSVSRTQHQWIMSPLL